MRGAEPREYSLYFKVRRHSRRCWIGREVGSKPLGQSTSCGGRASCPKAVERGRRQGWPAGHYPSGSRPFYEVGRRPSTTPQLLIDAVVRQTTVLIAQLATSGGVRAPLAHVANQVFLELASELERQGVSRKVSADMFGLALRGYQRRIQRLTESTTERGRSLWEAVLAYVGSARVRTRSQILARFARDDDELVRGVLHDLSESGLLFCSGSGGGTVYRAATPDELGEMRDLSRAEGIDELAWVIVFREGPLSREALAQRLLPHAGDLDAVLSRLCAGSRLREATIDGQRRYESVSFYVPLGDSSGWAAAVFDHFQAVVTTLCTKLRQISAEVPHSAIRRAAAPTPSSYGRGTRSSTKCSRACRNFAIAAAIYARRSTRTTCSTGCRRRYWT